LKDTVFDVDFDKARAAWDMYGSSDWQRDGLDATNGFAFEVRIRWETICLQCAPHLSYYLIIEDEDLYIGINTYALLLSISTFVFLAPS
jgi:hypothetical protein